MVTGADAASWRQALAEDGWSRRLTTPEGWRKFTMAEARPPDLPDGQQWISMTEADRELYDEYQRQRPASISELPQRPCTSVHDSPYPIVTERAVCKHPT